ncbi:hypothetical protein RJT34_01837 [Clitoria ternatea]|uniref:WRKY domain-containing protein n=1 Tax=Clitoria ternatea TaxID=43366 RepID=A0AAN9Q0N7_CLITE
MGEEVPEEENERLKLSLARVVNDTTTSDEEKEESDELVSLSLGISLNGKCEKKKKNKNLRESDENLKEGLALGLDIRRGSDEERKKEEEVMSEMWPPSKVLKAARSEDKSGASQHSEPKKARVCIRARCDTQTMNDGCQWRKYGQKMAKGNPCPRSYYRCTVSPSCPVQRCAEDMSILITTYEGTHNHPLPTSATTIAYTTSAAASMLQSPSLTSQLGVLANSDTHLLINSNLPYNLNTLNFTSSFHQFPKPPHFHNSSISTSNSHPTITLDLTAPQTTSIPHIGKFNPAAGFSVTPPKHAYSSTSLGFSSNGSTVSPLQSSILQSPWSPYSDYFNYGASNRNQDNGSLMNNAKQAFQGHPYNHAFSQQQPLLPDSIAATTYKAITTNPKFQSALAAALTTYVGVNGEVRENQIQAKSASLDLNLRGDMVHTRNADHNICNASSRYMRMSSSAPNPPAQVSKSSFGSSSSNMFNQFLNQWY